MNAEIGVSSVCASVFFVLGVYFQIIFVAPVIGMAVGLFVLAASSVVVVVLAAAPSLVVELVVPVSVEEVAVAAALVVALAVVTAVALVAVGASDGETYPSVQALPSQHPSLLSNTYPGRLLGRYIHPGGSARTHLDESLTTSGT